MPLIKIPTRLIGPEADRLFQILPQIIHKITEIFSPARDPGERKEMPEAFAELARDQPRKAPDESHVFLPPGNFDHEMYVIASNREPVNAECEALREPLDFELDPHAFGRERPLRLEHKVNRLATGEWAHNLSLSKTQLTAVKPGMLPGK